MTTNAYKYLQNLLGERISLGMAIRAIRNNDNISQGVFAKKLNITQSYLSDIEHNRKQISPKKADRNSKMCLNSGRTNQVFKRLPL